MLSIPCGIDAGTAGFEVGGDQSEIIRSVFHEQESQALERFALCDRACCQRLLSAWLGNKITRVEHGNTFDWTGVDSQSESAANTRGAGKGDVPAEHLRESLADGQPKPGAAETPGDGRVGLHERIERILGLPGRHADAGVFDIDS